MTVKDRLKITKINGKKCWKHSNIRIVTRIFTKCDSSFNKVTGYATDEHSLIPGSENHPASCGVDSRDFP
jgi:hypothetical protein